MVSTSQQDQPSEFESLYREYQKMIRGVVYNICGANPLDDVVQDVWLKVWKGLPDFNRQSQVKTWLYRIAVNAALDHYRKGKKTNRETELKPDAPGPDRRESDLLYRDLVQKGLDKLSEKHRVVVVLADLEELPLHDVARITKTSEGTIKSRLHYARKELLNFFQREGLRV